MLADGGAHEPSLSRLRAELHLPATQFRKLIAFVARLLPCWRDDPRRPAETAEDKLSEQLCGFLEDEARATPGFEIFKFQREPHDEAKSGRNLDIAAKPSGTSIWVEDRHYSPYDIFPQSNASVCRRPQARNAIRANICLVVGVRLAGSSASRRAIMDLTIPSPR